MQIGLAMNSMIGWQTAGDLAKTASQKTKSNEKKGKVAQGKLRRKAKKVGGKAKA